MFLLPAFLLGHGPALDWNALLGKALHQNRGSLTHRLNSSAPSGWTVTFRREPEVVAALPGGRLLWLYGNPPKSKARSAEEPDEVDGARILVWKSGGRLRFQVLQRDAVTNKFGYGDGVLYGTSRLVGNRLIVSGVRFGMSPFAYGGIEIWDRTLGGWKKTVDVTSEHELSEIPTFVGNGTDVLMTLRMQPDALLVPHGGGDHPRTIARYHYLNGKYKVTFKRVDSPLRAVDDLVNAVQTEDESLGRSRTSSKIWRRAKGQFVGEWSPEDQHEFHGVTTITLYSRKSEKVFVRLTVRKVDGRYRVTAIKPTFPHRRR